jgi:hypothetical protein
VYYFTITLQIYYIDLLIVKFFLNIFNIILQVILHQLLAQIFFFKYFWLFQILRNLIISVKEKIKNLKWRSADYYSEKL